MPGITVRQSFPDLVLATMLPAIDEVIFEKYNRFPAQYSQIFRVQDSNRAIEQTTEVIGVGLFRKVTEGGAVTYDSPVPGFNKTYTHVDYALGVQFTHQMVRDDKYAIMTKMATQLGSNAKESREIAHASVFNNGFDGAFVGPDGQPLFSASHPLKKAGGVQRNTLAVAADLDIPSLELALTDFRRMKNPAGIKIRVKPVTLMVPPELEFAASEIMNASMRSDTANNTPNAFKNRVGMPSFRDLMVYDYLTDVDAWFVLADKEDHELRSYTREAPVTLHEMDFSTRAMKTAMWYADSYGWSSFYGVYGSPGAN